MDKEQDEKETPRNGGGSLGLALDSVGFKPLGRRVMAKKGVAKKRLRIKKSPLTSDGEKER
ncbi:hypothetical protein [Rhizobium leguminosarum]|uniref:hypothetical protein n=1 Tax=Rhizobium leguminosarum TaxID=384 RepID=UPI003F9E4188